MSSKRSTLRTSHALTILPRLLIWVMIAFCMGSAAHAQTVLQGVVTDRSTNNPIVGAKLYNCSFCGVLTTTDGNGNYSLTAQQLNNNGSGTLIFQASGYYVASVPYTITASPTTLNTNLLPGGVILQGTVSDAATQAGIVGAGLNISTSKPVTFQGYSASTITTTGGQYVIDSSQFYESAATGFDVAGISASAAGYFNYQASGFHVAPPFPITQNVSMIAASGVVLQGVVTDRSTNNPIVGAKLYNCSFCGVLTTTDGNGNYSLTAQQLNNNGSGTLIFQASGYYVASVPYTITASPTTLNTNLLPGGVILQGTVSDAATQAGIVGAGLNISTSKPVTFQGYSASTITTTGGQYVIDSSQFYESAATGFDVAGISASAAGYFNYQASGFHVAPPFPITQNVSMIAASGVVLQGVVTDRSTNNPIVGAKLYNCSFCGVLTTTDGNGNYSLTAQQLNNNGSGTLIFQASGYYVASVPYTITASPTTLNTNLLPGGVILQGTVSDAATQAGIVGAGLNISTSKPVTFQGYSASTITTTGGQYVIDSSQFYESAATGFDVAGISASAAGYFNYQASGFHVGPPFPITHDLHVSSDGTLRSITIATNPPGLNISVDGTTYTSPQRFDWVPSNEHTIATSTPQAVSAGVQNAFVGWSDNGALSHSIVVPNADTTYTASFKTQYSLTTVANPAAEGSITAGGWFDSGASVAITASPNAGYRFTGFAGDLSGTGNPQSLLMNGPKAVSANFAPLAVATTTTVASSLNPSVYGEFVTYTATVTSSSAGTQTGTVTFTQGANVLLTVPLNGGQAKINSSAQAVGNASIVATYGGDSSFQGSTSMAITQSVQMASTTVGVTSNLNPSRFGQAVTFTATITAQFGGNAYGTVTFKDGATTLGMSPVSGNSNSASLITSSLNTGPHSITASYSGDSNFTGSTSSALSQTVTQASTTLALTSSANPSGFDQLVTLTATITPQFGGQATGVVTFTDGGSLLGKVLVSGNVANLTTRGLAIGTHTITASYGGDTNFTGSTAPPLSQVVNQASTSTNLTSSPNPSVQGSRVTFTATVTSAFGSTLTGRVTFLKGTVVLATKALNSGGVSKFITTALPPGSNSITAVYGGDTNDTGSTSGAVNQVVLAATTTTLTSSVNPSSFGEGVTLTASVASSVGPPPGGEMVSFNQGALVLGTAPLSGGSAAITISTFTVGTKSITADYAGDSNFATSKSNAVKQVVNKAASTTNLTSSFNPSTAGRSVTFTATVAPAFGGTPSGVVEFLDGATTLKTVVLSGDVATFTTSQLTAGSHTITANYKGNPSFNSSSGSLTQTVN